MSKPIESILALLLAVSGTGVPPVAAQTSVPAAAPGGPAPRLSNGRPDLTGVWMPPYVPDMTRSARDQQGYAEPPFSPADTPDRKSTRLNSSHRL